MNVLSTAATSLSEKMGSFLENKPIWAVWIIHTVLVGLMFGVFYAVMSLLALKWWGAALSIVAIGVIWGTLVHTKKELRKKGPQEKH